MDLLIFFPPVFMTSDLGRPGQIQTNLRNSSSSLQKKNTPVTCKFFVFTFTNMKPASAA